MRMALLAMTVAVVSAGSAMAGDSAPTAISQAPLLYVCDHTDLTKRSFAREYGAISFVSAEAVAGGATWEGAKCITPTQYARLQSLRTRTIRSASLR